MEANPRMTRRQALGTLGALALPLGLSAPQAAPFETDPEAAGAPTWETCTA